MAAASSQFQKLKPKHRTDAPTEHVARIAWILITLLSDGVLEYARCVDLFGISQRQFQRDVRKIRSLGAPHGFAISHTKSGRVFLSAKNRRISNLSTNGRQAAATLARLAAAFGGPIQKEISFAIGDATADAAAGFLVVREPLPSASARITQVFEELKAAAAGPARVEFDYTSARGTRTNRRVEPYHIVERAGRYYLVAYDLARRDWRHFALDAITGKITKSGTFSTRTVPERFLADRAVGWLGGIGITDVTFHLAQQVAASVCSRVWQRGQRVWRSDDGSAEITLAFEDLGEAVRWSLQFGRAATIVAPPEAVALAGETARHIAEAYTAQGRKAREGRRTA